MCFAVLPPSRRMDSRASSTAQRVELDVARALDGPPRAENVRYFLPRPGRQFMSRLELRF
jgi:hypothetical protein